MKCFVIKLQRSFPLTTIWCSFNRSYDGLSQVIENFIVQNKTKFRVIECNQYMIDVRLCICIYVCIYINGNIFNSFHSLLQHFLCLLFSWNYLLMCWISFPFYRECNDIICIHTTTNNSKLKKKKNHLF